MTAILGWAFPWTVKIHLNHHWTSSKYVCLCLYERSCDPAIYCRYLNILKSVASQKSRILRQSKMHWQTDYSIPNSCLQNDLPAYENSRFPASRYLNILKSQIPWPVWRCSQNYSLPGCKWHPKFFNCCLNNCCSLSKIVPYNHPWATLDNHCSVKEDQPENIDFSE